MPFLCCLYSLRPGTDRDACDEFVRTEDIPLTHRLPSVRSYNVYRFREPVEGSLEHDYVELLGFTTRAESQRDMSGETWAAGMRAMYEHGLETEVCFVVSEVV